MFSYGKFSPSKLTPSQQISEADVFHSIPIPPYFFLEGGPSLWHFIK